MFGIKQVYRVANVAGTVYQCSVQHVEEVGTRRLTTEGVIDAGGRQQSPSNDSLEPGSDRVDAMGESYLDGS